MIRPSTPVLLDACVLANFSVCDTLLRLAEAPRLFDPLWSDQIIRETTRVLASKLGWPTSLVDYFESQLRTNFAEAFIHGYEPLVERMANDEKDRHVLAAAVHAHATIIVTFNLRDFQPEQLRPWGVTAIHPQEFLLQLFDQESELVLRKLRQQAADRGRSLGQLMDLLNKTVPEFAKRVSRTMTTP